MALLPENFVRPYIEGTLLHSAVAPEAGMLDLPVLAMTRLADIGIYHVPFFVVVDVTAILRLGYETPFAWETYPAEWDEARRARQLRYEKHFLNPLLMDPALGSVLEHLRFQEDATSPLLRLVELLMRKFGPLFPNRYELNPAHMRRALESMRVSSVDPAASAANVESLSEGEVELEDLQEDLEGFLDAVATRVHWNELLAPEDRFELEHWAVLTREALRVGCRQLIQSASRFPDFDVRRFDAQQEDADQQTMLEDESHYPTGGFSEVTNRGSFENLLLSELIYMENRPGEIDMFDLRFVEGELLFYSRDSGQLRRFRRTVHIYLDLGESFEVKSMGYPVRYSTLVQALVLRIIQDLFLVFVDDALHIQLHYVCDGEPQQRAVHQNQIDIMSLLLANEIEHGWVTIDLAASPTAEELETLATSDRKLYLLVFENGHVSSTWPDRLDVLAESVRFQSVIVPVGGESEWIPEEGRPQEELSKMKNSVTGQLLGAT